MTKLKGIMILCTVVSIGAVFTGCTQTGKASETVTTSQEIPTVEETPIIDEMPQQVDSKRGLKCYYMVVEGKQEKEVPNLTLFSDGTFGFSYDLLNSYYAVGTYKIQEDKIIASTEDGKYAYTFEKQGDKQYRFIADESSDVSLINKACGEEIKDGAIFELDGETMGAVIKEINGHTMLVSSREDNCPGTFEVSVPEGIDLYVFRGGDDVLITWDGEIKETDPAQITASYVELRPNTKVIEIK